MNEFNEPSPFAVEDEEKQRKPRRGRIDLSQLDKLPPHSLESEQGIIGCCMTDQECVDDVISAGCQPGWFYDLRHQELWQTILALRNDNHPIDLISLGQRLKDSGKLDGVGGLQYMSELMDTVPSTANLGVYLEAVSEKALRRKLIQISTDTIAIASDESKPLEPTLAGAETAILGVRQGFEGEDTRTMKNLVSEAIDALQDRIQNGDPKRVTTGFRALDRICKGGFRPGQMAVIAARPSMGKTSMALSMARQIAAKGIPVGFFSLEMSEEEVTHSLCAQESGVDWEQFDNINKPSEAQMKSIVGSVGRIRKLPIFIHDGMRRGSRFKMTPSTIAAKSRRWVAKNGIKIIFVDYLQRIHNPSRRERREQVDEISGAMKELARELAIPVVVLAQLNREFEKEKARKPRLSDLRESGAIEQDADFVGMLYNPSEDDLDFDADPSIPIDVNLYVAKNRKGVRFVDIQLAFKRSVTLFEEKGFRPE